MLLSRGIRILFVVHVKCSRCGMIRFRNTKVLVRGYQVPGSTMNICFLCRTYGILILVAKYRHSIPPILLAMQSHVSTGDVQKTGCGALLNLSVNAQQQVGDCCSRRY